MDVERNALALGRTAFFPTGGGQPHDTGELVFTWSRAEVVDVVKDREGTVRHTLVQP